MRERFAGTLVPPSRSWRDVPGQPMHEPDACSNDRGRQCPVGHHLASGPFQSKIRATMMPCNVGTRTQEPPPDSFTLNPTGAAAHQVGSPVFNASKTSARPKTAPVLPAW